MFTILRVNVPVDHARAAAGPPAGAIPAFQTTGRSVECQLAGEPPVHQALSVHVWTKLWVGLGRELESDASLDDWA